MTVAKDAIEIAAKATNLRPDQIERAVAEYRAAAAGLHVEPEWQAQTHFCMNDCAWHSFVDPSQQTKVVMFVWEHKVKGGLEQTTRYAFARNEYESFGEARAIELEASTKFKPHAVTS